MRVALFLAMPLVAVGAFFVWRWNANRPPSRALCVEQAERRLERMFGEGLAKEANEHPKDYEHLRTNMITTCERYWTKRYAECERDQGGFGLTEACEKLGRVRDR